MVLPISDEQFAKGVERWLHGIETAGNTAELQAYKNVYEILLYKQSYCSIIRGLLLEEAEAAHFEKLVKLGA